MKKIVTLVLLAVAVMASAEDVIVTKEAAKIGAKIEEVGPTEIKYKKASLPNGPMFVMPTEEILCVIFDNGEVMIFDKPKKEEEVKKTVLQVYNPEVMKEDGHIFEDRPRGLVLQTGSLSMLYKKDVRVLMQMIVDNAEAVSFGYNECGMTKLGMSLQEYCRMRSDLENLLSSNFVEVPCERYKERMTKVKCQFIPLKTNHPTTADGDYIMTINVQKIDVGESSAMSFNNGSNKGGAVIYGTLNIYDIQNQRIVCEMLVDRVKGLGAQNAAARIENVITELICTKLGLVKAE